MPVAPLYDGFVASTKTALAELAVHWDVEVAGLVWMHGESDSIPAFANAHLQHLRRFVTQLRVDLAVPDLPVVVGKIAIEPWKGCGGTPEVVRAAQDQLASEDARVVTIETDDLGKINPAPTDCVIPDGEDPAHYGTPGLLEMGERFAAAMLALGG
jgi:hypothetical protein